MAGPAQHARIFRFEAFEFDPGAGELRRQGTRLRLSGQPLEILAMLLEHPGEIVRREEIRTRLWPADTFVDFEHSLNAAVNKLREALGDSAEAPRFIETLPRRGYRFVAPVQAVVNGRPAEAFQPSAAPASRRWIAIAGFALALLVAAGLLAWREIRPRAAPASTSGRVLMAVLPFQNLSGDSQQDYFSDSLTDEMITEVGDLNPQRLGVIARTSVMPYKHSQESAEQIGRELGVAYLLEGSVLRSGQRVRITAQLIRVSDQTHLWARSYERDLSDILAVQDDVARAVAGQIELKLDAAGRRLTAPRAVNPGAYDDYLKTLYLCQRGTPEDIRKAAGLLEKATANDPRFAVGYAMLSADYAHLSTRPYTPTEAMTKARAAALKALALDDHIAEAHVALGFVKLNYDFDWAGAEKEYNRAAELDPNSLMLLGAHWAYLSTLRRFAEALAETRRAEKLDPMNLGWRCSEGRTLYYAHRYDEAIRVFNKALEINPSFEGNCLWLGLAYEQVGRYADAIGIFEKGIQTSPSDTFAVGGLGRAYALAGKRAEAQKQLRKLLALEHSRYISPWDLSLIYAALGDKQQVFNLLEKEFRDRGGFLVYLNIDPLYDSYHSDPRFQDLLRRIGLPSEVPPRGT